VALKVVVWGTGNVGRPAIRAVAAHRGLELVGVIVADPDKVGVDAGAQAGIDTLGIQATDEVRIAEADDVDAVVYAVNADFRPEASLEEVERVLVAGTDVVSTSFHGLLHPPSAPEPLRSRVAKACLEGDSSILVSGIDPGWVLDILPLLLTGVSADITEVRAQEIANYTGYDQPQAVRDLCGFGHPLDYPTPILSEYGLMTVWAPMIRVLADGQDLELDSITTSTDRRALEQTVHVDGMGEFEAGTQGAFRFEVNGVIGGRPVLVAEHVTRIDDGCAPDWPQSSADGGVHRVVITGRPNLTVSVHGEDASDPGAAAGGNTLAANRIVNAIPAVCEAEPGPIHPLALPSIVGSSQLRLSDS